ncbi:DKNYY domain-containing protein [Pseudozobellia thermophila]|uniref:DKNYY family protein n=1 Tax=Pseudozobellia thermophila TaxID=192903 RepID=A0A1M6LJ02_9FLAO|nr:DKNYY domain-containing protein [Pseudozobellia thermophila]SHJ71165.1 DKNYY family protein [Pseudozobellia thermophila]
MDDLIILDIFWDRQLVKDKSGKEFEIFRGKDYDHDWVNLGHGYSKNKDCIYYYLNTCFEKYLNKIDIDSFSVIEANEAENTTYFKDKNAVYLESYMCGSTILPDASPNNFKILDIENGYSTSGEIDYWYESKLPYSLSEMTPINECYQRVGDAIYYGHTVRMTCDVDTFEQVHPKVDTLFKDKDHLYFKSEIVEGANPATFQFLEECIGEDAPYYLECDIHYYAKDDQYAYFVNEPFGIKVIKTRDLENFRFEVIDEIGYGRDSKYRYEKGRRKKIN